MKHQLIGALVLDSVVVRAALQFQWLPPSFVGCPATAEVCKSLISPSVTTVADIARITTDARACANSQATCSVDLDIQITATEEHTCGDSAVGYVLGSDFPKGWRLEPSFTVSDTIEGCEPSGGRYSENPTTNVCDGKSGKPSPTTPLFDGARTFSFGNIGPAATVSGCTPKSDLTYTLSMTRFLIFGQDETDPDFPESETGDENDTEDDDSAPGAVPPSGPTTKPATTMKATSAPAAFETNKGASAQIALTCMAVALAAF